jgi:protein-arginine kinase activator protein McsA
MTKKEMNTLVDMIIEALVKKQKELDNEFFDKVDKRSDEGYNGMMEMEDMDDSLVEDISKKEGLYIRLQNLYDIQSKILKDENYEAAAEISKTIKELKKRLNEM